MVGRSVSHVELARVRAEFYCGVGLGIGGALAAHFLGPTFGDDPGVRFALVIVFFTCLGTATWSFTTPYQRFLRTDLRWKYADAGPALHYNLDLYVARIGRMTAGPAWMATTAVIFAFLLVLSYWEIGAPLQPLREPLRWGTVLTLLGIPIVGLTMARSAQEALALRRSIAEQTAASGIAVRTASDAARAARENAAEGMTVTGPLCFTAGGYEWHWSDFYKNAAIFGQSGSGKTVCVLNALLDGLLASSAKAGLPPSGLLLDPKGDFRTKIGTLMRRHGWERQLAVIDPSDPARGIRWNPLDSASSAVELAGRFAGVLETLSQGSDKDRYFIDSATTFMRHMIVILRCAHPNQPPSLVEIYDCATDDHKLHHAIERVSNDAGIEPRRAVAFMFNEWENLALDTKSIVRSFLSNMLGPFLTPPYDKVFSGNSTITLGEAIDRGVVIYVYLPLAQAEVMSRVVATFVKLEYYREVLARPDKQRPSFFLCDEFQVFFTVGSGRGDADAFERTRQSNHANIVAFQNLNALYKQTDRKEPVDNLLGNCATQIFLRNTDRATNEYGSKLFGEQIETLLGIGATVGNARQGQQSQVGGAAQYGPKVREDAFARLAVPSIPDNVTYAECITHLGSRAFIEAKRQRWRVHPIT